MGFLEVRSNIKVLNPPDSRAQACVRSAPERVVLDVAPGVTPSDKPPVRVFLGTEPGQYRAERIFVYSIEKYRNPSRVYEIYLMKDLAGFDRRGWTTGFTNYRFAIPHLAGRQGRAIFNDVDEAYCGDPADLFDAEMGNHGYLATSDTETSVMLIDCARMAPVWQLDAVQKTLKKEVLRNTLRECPGIRGDLPSEWTARDNDFVPGFSKLQHWTTLQTQPWRPVPGRFVYQPNATGHLWFDLKDAADAEGYQIFGPTHPSSLYTDRIERIKASPLRRERLPADIASQGSQQLENALEESGSRTLLEVGLSGHIRRENSSLCSTIALTHHDLATSGELPETCDGVVCRGVLDSRGKSRRRQHADNSFSRRIVVDGALLERVSPVSGNSLVHSGSGPGRGWSAATDKSSRRRTPTGGVAPSLGLVRRAARKLRTGAGTCQRTRLALRAKGSALCTLRYEAQPRRFPFEFAQGAVARRRGHCGRSLCRASLLDSRSGPGSNADS